MNFFHLNKFLDFTIRNEVLLPCISMISELNPICFGEKFVKIP